MPFNDNLPAENTNPWYTPLATAWSTLKAFVNGLETALAGKLDTSQRGAVNGVASLGSDGRIPTAQLPALAVTEFLGSSANQAAMLALVGQQGDWTTRTDLGTVFIITGSDPTQLSSWTEMSYPTAPVLSVAGKTGVVTLVASDVGAATTAQGAKADSSVQLAGDQTIAGIKTFSAAPVVPVGAWAINRTTGLQSALDAKAPLASPTFTGTVSGITKAMVGLGNVDNTSDAGKPVSTAQQAALDAKVPTSRTVAGYALTADVPRAGLNVRGVGDIILIPNGGTVPAGTPADTIVIEAGA